MLNQIISFVERDVDGCGTDVGVMVLIKTDSALTAEHKEKLLCAIEDAKNEIEEWDTDTVVNEAMERVFGEDAEYEYIIADIEVEF